MKTIIKKFILLAALPVLLLGCDAWLDPTKDGALDDKDVWGEIKYAFGFLNNTYNNLPSGYNRLSQAMLASGSDEAVHSDPVNNIHGFNDGRWNQYFLIDNVWYTNFEGIRKANMFIERISSVPIDEKSTINGTMEEKIRTRERMIGEAYFLRAMFYFELVKRYGGVPLITKTLDYDETLNLTRASMEECIKQISDDCDSAFNRLPEVYNGKLSGFDDKGGVGRATTGAALALKSKALLYWASPLHNPANETKRWEAAATAAELVINTGQYDLIQFKRNETLGNIFFVSGTNFRMYNKDIVFSTSYTDTYLFEQQNTPPRLGGNGYTNPTQNLADAFGMKDGKGIHEQGSTYDPQNPYIDRDPRFYMTFLTNGTNWKINDKDTEIETFTGGLDATGKYETSTKTGYYLSKMISGNAVWDGRESKVNRTWPIIRFSEILLNYAEALNEAQAAPAEEVYTTIEKIRQRAGLDPYQIARGKSQEEMRNIIRNERQVELAFEEQRFFDIRRWRLMDDEQMKEKILNIKGIKIEKEGEDTYTYAEVDLEKRKFEEKMYFYPIPETEIQKCKNLTQNPGW